MNLNVGRVMLIPRQFATKQALNTTWEAFYKSLMPLIMFLFLVTTRLVISGPARLTMVCLRRVDLSVKVRPQRPHM